MSKQFGKPAILLETSAPGADGAIRESSRVMVPHKIATFYSGRCSMKCPYCGLINPDNALRCDCGYDFETRTVEPSYLTPAQQILIGKGEVAREVQNGESGERILHGVFGVIHILLRVLGG